MPLAPDNLQVLALQCGEAIAHLTAGDVEARSQLGSIANQTRILSVHDCVSEGGVHAVSEIASAATLSCAAASGAGDSQSTTRACVQIGQALASADLGHAQARLTNLAQESFGDRTPRVEGILHYASYVLLGFGAAQSELLGD